MQMTQCLWAHKIIYTTCVNFIYIFVLTIQITHIRIADLLFHHQLVSQHCLFYVAIVYYVILCSPESKNKTMSATQGTIYCTNHFSEIDHKLTISSIFRILRTVSEARVNALLETKRGCKTFSSKMLVIVPWEIMNICQQ